MNNYIGPRLSGVFEYTLCVWFSRPHQLIRYGTGIIDRCFRPTPFSNHLVSNFEWCYTGSRGRTTVGMGIRGRGIVDRGSRSVGLDIRTVGVGSRGRGSVGEGSSHRFPFRFDCFCFLFRWHSEWLVSKCVVDPHLHFLIPPSRTAFTFPTETSRVDSRWGHHLVQ